MTEKDTTVYASKPTETMDATLPLFLSYADFTNLCSPSAEAPTAQSITVEPVFNSDWLEDVFDGSLTTDIPNDQAMLSTERSVQSTPAFGQATTNGIVNAAGFADSAELWAFIDPSIFGPSKPDSAIATELISNHDTEHGCKTRPVTERITLDKLMKSNKSLQCGIGEASYCHLLYLADPSGYPCKNCNYDQRYSSIGTQTEPQTEPLIPDRRKRKTARRPAGDAQISKRRKKAPAKALWPTRIDVGAAEQITTY